MAGWIGTRDDRDKPLAALGPELERGAAPELRRLALEELRALPPGDALDVAGVTARVAWRRPRRSARMAPTLVRWTLDELSGWASPDAARCSGSAVR